MIRLKQLYGPLMSVCTDVTGRGGRPSWSTPPPISGQQSLARPHGSFVQWQQSGERACVWCRARRVGVFAQRLSHGFGLVTRNTWCLHHSQRSAAEQGQAAATSQVEWDQALLVAHFGLLLVKQEKEAVKGVNAVQAGPETGGEWWSAGAEGKTVAWRISCQQWLNELEHEIMSMRTTTRRSLGRPKTQLLILPKRVWQHLIWKYDSNLILEKYRNASVVEEDWHEEDLWNTVIQTSFCQSRVESQGHPKYHTLVTMVTASITPRCVVRPCLTLVPARAPSPSRGPAPSPSSPQSESARAFISPSRLTMAAANRGSKYQAATVKPEKCQNGSQHKADIWKGIARFTDNVLILLYAGFLPAKLRASRKDHNWLAYCWTLSIHTHQSNHVWFVCDVMYYCF